MFRLGVAFLAVCAGALTAAADLAVSMPLLTPEQRGDPGKQSPEEKRLVFDACVTFYGIAYSTGRLVYRWRRAHAEAEELRGWSRWHMAVLNAIGGSWLIVSGVPALQLAVIRPSFIVGLLLILLTLRDGWRALRVHVPGP